MCDDDKNKQHSLSVHSPEKQIRKSITDKLNLARIVTHHRNITQGLIRDGKQGRVENGKKEEGKVIKVNTAER